MNLSTFSPSKQPSVRSITPVELAGLATRPRIIDVREAAEYTGELGHIRGAELVPLATLETASRHWTKQEPLVIACRSGARSARGAAMLIALGFRKILNLEGGTLAHVNAGLPTERQ